MAIWTSVTSTLGRKEKNRNLVKRKVLFALSIVDGGGETVIWNTSTQLFQITSSSHEMSKEYDFPWLRKILYLEAHIFG